MPPSLHRDRAAPDQASGQWLLDFVSENDAHIWAGRIQTYSEKLYR
jgi:hypothetical protein